MKKRFIILTLTLIFLLASTLAVPCYAGPTYRTSTPVDNQTIAASGSYTSASFRLGDGFLGIASIQIAISGSGTCKVEYELTVDGTNFIEPTGAVDIATGLTSSDDDEIFPIDFAGHVANRMKIKVTETGGANSVTVTVKLILMYES